VPHPTKASGKYLGKAVQIIKKSTSSLADGPYRVLGYAPGAEAQDRFFESKMAVNPKTGEVIYVAAVQGDTNIDLLTLTKH
jgi:hypothetical protein